MLPFCQSRVVGNFYKEDGRELVPTYNLEAGSLALPLPLKNLSDDASICFARPQEGLKHEDEPKYCRVVLSALFMIIDKPRKLVLLKISCVLQ